MLGSRRRRAASAPPMARPDERPEDVDAAETERRRIARSWHAAAVIVAVLAAAAAALFIGVPLPVRLVAAVQLVGLLALVGTFVATRFVERRTADARLADGASLTKLLQGLSRSSSPEAVVATILDDLRTTAGADHVVIVRLRPAERVLEATLVSASAAVPTSTTRLSTSLLEPTGLPASTGAPVMAPRPMLVGAAAGPGEGPVNAPPRRRRRAVDAPRATPAEPAPLTPELAGTIAARIADRVRLAYGLRHTIEAPLTANGAVVGALVASRRTAEPWAVSSRRVLDSAAEEVSAALARAYAQQAAETRATIDGLTGLPNRRHFDELAAVIGRGRRAGDSLGILMLDIDHFKKLNDRYGHAAGDAVLRAVAGAIATAVRVDDTPARYGGEEFVVILREAGREQASDVAERIRSAVSALAADELGVRAHVTVSVGAAVGEGSAVNVPDLVEQADKALYQAKRKGRDQVVLA
jgi:diguanylate cyclase (GGDEF)-like protein